MKIKPKQIIVALDFDSTKEVKETISLLDPKKFRVKVGKQLFTSQGPKIIDMLHDEGFDIFLDLKLHDIPNTVSKALKNIFNKNIWMTNIHLLGGEKMSLASVDAKGGRESLLVGVTILTSLENSFLKEIGIEMTLDELVLKLTSNSQKYGLDGVVCSVNDVRNIKKNFKNLLTVTPGIRMKVDSNDQVRSSTLRNAVEANSDFMVMGREITASENKSDMIAELESYIIV
tara:strand:+ start:2616 stop:3305 length:690 start_codon:yes stop_codon:yes gene_type:complete